VRSLVIYATTSGNTRQIAEAIAGALSRRGAVSLLPADQAPATLPQADLVLIGGPTERHTMTEPMARFLARLAPASVHLTPAAAFDTRLRWPKFISGSAADEIDKRLWAAGARVVAPPESFMVSAKPELEAGETARAAEWASAIADRLRVEASVAT
jgi:flavodoxin